MNDNFDKAPLDSLQQQFHQAHQQQQGAKAWEFLRQMHIDADKVSHQLQLGWADHRFTKSLAARNTPEGAEQRETLKQCGIPRTARGIPSKC